MNWRSRSSRAMAPKMRVPRGFFSLSIRTTALRSNLTYEPSPRRVWLRVRTIDAADDVARLDVAAGRGLLDAGDDRVADAGGAPLVARGAAAEHLDAHHFLGAGVVGHVEPRLHLDHGTATLAAGRYRSGPSSPVSSAGPGRPGPRPVIASRVGTGLDSFASLARSLLAARPRPRRPGPAGRRRGRSGRSATASAWRAAGSP